MIELFKRRVFPIGIDLDSNSVKMSQLGFNSKSLYLYAAGSESRPEAIESRSADWQRWAVRAIKDLLATGRFKGREVIAALPSEDIFIDQVKVTLLAGSDIEASAFDKAKHKFGFAPSDAVVKYLAGERSGGNGQVDVLVMAAEREIVDRHLAIYEKAGLQIKGMSVWPLAMTTSYVKFFGKRRSDMQTVAMLIDIGRYQSSIVMCRHKNILFIRLLPIGFSQLQDNGAADKLISEADACFRYFQSLGNGRVERLVFLPGRAVEGSICEKLASFARTLQIPAQTGDVLSAVVIKGDSAGIDRRGPGANWTTAFGLSLSGT